MARKIKCSSCFLIFNLDESWTDAKSKCPQCYAVVDVPLEDGDSEEHANETSQPTEEEVEEVFNFYVDGLNNDLDNVTNDTLETAIADLNSDLKSIGWEGADQGWTLLWTGNEFDPYCREDAESDFGPNARSQQNSVTGEWQTVTNDDNEQGPILKKCDGYCRREFCDNPKCDGRELEYQSMFGLLVRLWWPEDDSGELSYDLTHPASEIEAMLIIKYLEVGNEDDAEFNMLLDKDTTRAFLSKIRSIDCRMDEDYEEEVFCGTLEQCAAWLNEFVLSLIKEGCLFFVDSIPEEGDIGRFPMSADGWEYEVFDVHGGNHDGSLIIRVNHWDENDELIEEEPRLALSLTDEKLANYYYPLWKKVVIEEEELASDSLRITLPGLYKVIKKCWDKKYGYLFIIQKWGQSSPTPVIKEEALPSSPKPVIKEGYLFFGGSRPEIGDIGRFPMSTDCWEYVVFDIKGDLLEIYTNYWDENDELIEVEPDLVLFLRDEKLANYYSPLLKKVEETPPITLPGLYRVIEQDGDSFIIQKWGR